MVIVLYKINLFNLKQCGTRKPRNIKEFYFSIENMNMSGN